MRATSADRGEAVVGQHAVARADVVVVDEHRRGSAVPAPSSARRVGASAGTRSSRSGRVPTSTPSTRVRLTSAPSPASSPACVPPDPSATTIQSGSASSCVRSSSTASAYATTPDHRRAADRDRVRPSALGAQLGRRAPSIDASMLVVVVGAGEVQRRAEEVVEQQVAVVVVGRVAGRARGGSRARAGVAAAAVMRAWLLCGPPPVTRQSAPCASASAREQLELARLVAAEREPGEVVALHEQRRRRCRAPPRAGPSARAGSGSVRESPDAVGRDVTRRGPRGAATTRTPPTATPATAITVPTAIVGPFGGTGTRSRSRTGRCEDPDLPLALDRLAREVLVGVHRDRVTDRPQHRQVGDRVAVRVRLREVDAVRGGVLRSSRRPCAGRTRRTRARRCSCRRRRCAARVAITSSAPRNVAERRRPPRPATTTR